MNRRDFLKDSAVLGAAVSIAPHIVASSDADAADQKVRVGVIGCGSVSRKYFPNLKASPHVEIVSACDIIEERAKRAAEWYEIPNAYTHIDDMLAGASFDLLVNLTDMQEHERLNRQALEAGKHVWTEKPMANSLAAGQKLLTLANEKQLRLWGAPTVVESPQFAFMAEAITSGKLGALASAHGSYGHLGPNWAEFFYASEGGSLPDLGVYNLTFLTGLLGPARAVTAMTSIVTPVREIHGKGSYQVAEEDNAVVLMDHGNGVISQVDSSFNYFSPHEHQYDRQMNHTVTITGRNGVMKLVGYDWAPHGVDLATTEEPSYKRFADARHTYVWEGGAVLLAECLVTGKEPLLTPEHALHVLEIIQAARQSQAEGRRIQLESTFKWPVIDGGSQ